ncbi:MAG TPA: HD domain-containing protein [Steroidobacteraceae bacterium]|nr:HD domain-containing protein [Steroidobacteraceae bacterium]
MSPTSSLHHATPGDALAHGHELLAAAGLPAEALARAREVAALVLELTLDQALAIAALLHMARQAAPAAPALNATQRAGLGGEALRLAEQLAKLGEFRLDAHWSAGKALAAGQAETLRKMLLAVVGDPRLVVARLAEQLVRIRHAREESAALRQQIALEVEQLYAPLANRLGIWSLKWELEDLAFRASHPQEYQRIAQALNEKRRDRELYIERVKELLATHLRGAGIAAEVLGRPKHIYSIWRKMQRKGVPFQELYDIRAVRIIVASVAECYAALGVVHELWPFIPNEFDDYIATPKDNQYQSIHTAVSGPDGRPLEVQIRTRQMQEQAELGVAAHWRYKEGGGDRRYDEKIQQVRELLAGGQGGGDSDALTRLSAGLFRDRIYAMTPRGEVVDLPRGGTPLDFAFHVHSSLGERCRGAKVNGRITPLNQPLGSGDVVEIITGKEPAPSRDWLSGHGGYVVSARSKAKLRAYFRRLDEAAGIAPAAAVAEPAPQPQRPPPSARPRKAIGSARSPVEIEGVGDLPITLARCCAPMRPQPIRGYLTLGRGVTIHRADCPGLARMVKQKPQRLLQVEWNEGDATRIGATLLIEAFDRRGLLRDISDLIAEERLSIEGVTSDTDPRDRIARFQLRLTVRDAAELAKLQRRLARVPNVFKVRRAR